MTFFLSFWLVQPYYNELKWQTDRGRFEVKDRFMNKLMRKLVLSRIPAFIGINKANVSKIG